MWQYKRWHKMFSNINFSHYNEHNVCETKNIVWMIALMKYLRYEFPARLPGWRFTARYASFFGAVVVFKIRNLEICQTEFDQSEMVAHLNHSFNLGNHQYDDIKIFWQVNFDTHFCAHFHIIFFVIFSINLEITSI